MGEKWGEGWAAGEESGGKGRGENFFEKVFPLLHGNVQQMGRKRGESVRDLGKKGRMAMKDYLSAARRKRFCAGYLRTLDPERAAVEAGVKDGWALLADEAVRQELAGMRTLRAGEVRREDALRRLTELAFGRANDAVVLALSPERERLDVQGLDLSAVSEFKVTEKGAVEIRFLDRIKALEALCLLLERQADEEGAEDLIRALRGEEE